MYLTKQISRYTSSGMVLVKENNVMLASGRNTSMIFETILTKVLIAFDTGTHGNVLLFTNIAFYSDLFRIQIQINIPFQSRSSVLRSYRRNVTQRTVNMPIRTCESDITVKTLLAIHVKTVQHTGVPELLGTYITPDGLQQTVYNTPTLRFPWWCHFNKSSGLIRHTIQLFLINPMCQCQ